MCGFPLRSVFLEIQILQTRKLDRMDRIGRMDRISGIQTNRLARRDPIRMALEPFSVKWLPRRCHALGLKPMAVGYGIATKSPKIAEKTSVESGIAE